MVDDYVQLQSISSLLIDYERVFDSFQINKKLDLTLPFISDFLENKSCNTVPATPGRSNFGLEADSNIPPSMPKSELACIFGYDGASTEITIATPECVLNCNKTIRMGDNQERKSIKGCEPAMIDLGHSSWDSPTARSHETILVPEVKQTLAGCNLPSGYSSL